MDSHSLRPGGPQSSPVSSVTLSPRALLGHRPAASICSPPTTVGEPRQSTLVARRTCNPHMAHTFRQRRRGWGKRVIITLLKLRLHTEVAVESGPNERVSLGHAMMSRKLRRYIGLQAEPPCHPVTDSSVVAGESS